MPDNSKAFPNAEIKVPENEWKFWMDDGEMSRASKGRMTELFANNRRVFDALGRLFQGIGAANQTTSYAYDNVGNVAQTTDPLSNITGQSFDALNRLIQVAAPLSSTTISGLVPRRSGGPHVPAPLEVNTCYFPMRIQPHSNRR